MKKIISQSGFVCPKRGVCTPSYKAGREELDMESLGERLNYARKKKGYTQDSLAETIGVSRGVIYNLEKNKTSPQTIVLNAICSTLKINKDWLQNGTGEMVSESLPSQSAKILAELCEAAGELTEDEQLYLLDSIKSLRQRLSKGKN